MRQATESCEEAIATRQPARMVEGTTHIARLASRLLQLSKQEADNSEDQQFISVLGKKNLCETVLRLFVMYFCACL